MANEKDPLDDFLNDEGDSEWSNEEEHVLFNELEFEDEDEAREWKEEKKRMNAYREMPVFKKAWAIAELTRRLVETFDEQRDELHVGEQMINNAYMLGAKISVAEAADLFTLRMENAVIIKMAARELLAETSLCKAEKLADPVYLQLLRDELEEFRKLLNGWIKTFDPLNDIPDDWAIGFNYREIDENKK
jgi:hypothetical protein